MEYTIDQQKALKSMLEWVEKPIENKLDYLYTLNGAAGTGKTTIIKAFLEQINIPNSKIAVTAPTHKAKKVIQAATDFKSHTIQKLLGLRPDTQMDKFDVNNPVFNPIAEDIIQFFKIVIIDESSMLPSDAFNLLVDKAVDYKIRILFLGDSYQLPPINEIISRVFKDVKNQSTLTTVVRQSVDNPMSDILVLLRQDIDNGTNIGIEALLKQQHNIIGDKGFKCLDNVAFGDKMLEFYFDSEYEFNKDYIKFLSYTNDSVESWSKALRNRLLKEKANNLLNVGEILMSYSTIADNTYSLIIENSEDYVVDAIEEGFSSCGIKGIFTTLRNSRNVTKTVFIVTDIEHYKNIILPKLHLAQTKKYWRQFYAFKEEHLLMQNVLKDDKLPVNKWGNLISKKDLYYGYGCTTHKSQGSTYDNVAINLKNILGNQDQSERARLVYVALSRTRNINLILSI